MEKNYTNSLTKTDKRILGEKLLKYLQYIDKQIDTVTEYPANRMPSRTKQSVIGRFTRTVRALRRVIEDLNSSQSI
jgi:hypothetical protein